MQEDITNRTIAVGFKGAKITGRILRALLRGVLHLLKHHRQNVKQKKLDKKRFPEYKHGKQSLKDLQKSGQELTDIEVTDENIGSFEKYARKYNIDYCLKADKSQEPPQWYVFFRAKDEKLMEAAFKEYTAEELKEKKPSVRKKLEKHKEKAREAKQRERVKTKKKDRSETL